MSEWLAGTRAEAGTGDPGCPKHMVYGPCGGVRADRTCELGDRPCPFVDRDVVRWSGPAPPPAPSPTGLLARAADHPVVVTDLRVRPFDLASVTKVAGILAGTCDAVLVGEHHSRPDWPPPVMARAATDAGVSPWVTLTCRDRNRVVLESELAALAALGVDGVHCVTGDARAAHVRRDATQVFDVDGTRLTAMSRAAGLRASVAATPVAPPVERRAARLREKEAAGAELCMVNHCGGPGPVQDFVEASRAAGVTLPFIPCVAVITDRASAEVLIGFPGVEVDGEAIAAVLDAPDPVAAGIAQAVDAARRMLAVEGVVGVDLSGAATGGDEVASAQIMAAIGREVLGR